MWLLVSLSLYHLHLTWLRVSLGSMLFFAVLVQSFPYFHSLFLWTEGLWCSDACTEILPAHSVIPQRGKAFESQFGLDWTMTKRPSQGISRLNSTRKVSSCWRSGRQVLWEALERVNIVSRKVAVPKGHLTTVEPVQPHWKTTIIS